MPELQPNDLLKTSTSHWNSIKRNDPAATQLKDYLIKPPSKIENATATYKDATYHQAGHDPNAMETWNTLIQGLTQNQLVTTLVLCACEDRHPKATHEPATYGNAGPAAAIISRLSEPVAEDIGKYLKESGEAPFNMIRAYAAHAPTYQQRMKFPQNAYQPYIKETAFNPEVLYPDWYRPAKEVNWLAPTASYKQFRDHLVNHWTDSARSQGGVVAREIAYNMDSNPLHELDENPYTGYSRLSVPYNREIPEHVQSHAETLYQETQTHYANRDVETVTLYRGVKGSVGTPAPLESWTSNKAYAEKYAETSARDGGGELLQAEIPVEYLLFTHETIPNKQWNALAEHKSGPELEMAEYAVIGGGVAGR